MAEQLTPAPIQVQIAPAADPEAAANARFAEKLARMDRSPTMQPGDRERKPSANTAPDTPVNSPNIPEPTPETQEQAAEQAAEEGNYEFEWKGGRYAVPPELKELHDGYLRQEDYTVKQQEVAELRRSAEALLQQSRHQQELQQALAPQVQRLNAINEQLGQYMKLDWNALWSQDHNVAQQHSVNFSILNNQKQALEREVQQTASVHMTKLSEAQKTALEASDKAMAQKVKGWTRDNGKALNEFARKAYGFTENEVNTTLDPRALEMMHDAKSWRDLQGSKSSKVVAPQKTLKPAATTPTATANEKAAEIRKGFRTAKTDADRDRIAEKLFALKIR